MANISRRTLLKASFAVISMPIELALAESTVFYRNPGCECCHKWAGQMNEAGIIVTMVDSDKLEAVQTELGVPLDLQGCHVGSIGGYQFSGHTPPKDIISFLAAKPKALGLAVPGMPAESPGMENGGPTMPYEVIQFGADGDRKVFAKYS